jgi:hypothetical protein
MPVQMRYGQGVCGRGRGFLVAAAEPPRPDGEPGADDSYRITRHILRTLKTRSS